MAETTYRATYREYVGAIWEIQAEGLEARQSRLAEWLGVSRASVSEMVHKLAAEGLVVVDPLGLTEAGRHLAEVTVRRHRLAERFLSEVLHLPWDKVHHEAEVWENVISDDVEAAMWAAMDDPKTCPHGNPIPGAGYRAPEAVALSDVAIGLPFTVSRIPEELEFTPGLLDYLEQADVVPGRSGTITAASPDGTTTVVVNGRHVGIGAFASQRILVTV